VWLAELIKPDTITEEDEDEEAVAAAESNGAVEPVDDEQFVDKEVGTWVREQIQKRKEGRLNRHAKPALHAAPLDAIGSPSPTMDRPKATAGAVAV